MGNHWVLFSPTLHEYHPHDVTRSYRFGGWGDE